MKLSIIIPVYNSEKYISRCLDSLLNQKLSPTQYEIVVIDDGSSDKSQLIIKEYVELYSNLKLYSQQNLGVGMARNKGIDLAIGDYIYFIDSDDYIAHNVLSNLINYLEKFNLDILTFNSIGTINPNLNESLSKNNEKELESITSGIQFIANRPYKNEIWWYFIKRTFLVSSEIRFIKGRWMEDAIFTTELFLRTVRISHTNQDVHRHMITPNSAMTSKEPIHYVKVIRDNANAAVVFKSIIERINDEFLENRMCIKRLKTRQQSFVFFMMVRMLQSSISLSEIKSILVHMESSGAYPLNSFIGNDYNKLIYKILVKIFNNKNLFYLLFLSVNPFFYLKNKIIN